MTPVRSRLPSESRLDARRITPQRARRILERLGPTFIKLGQFLALRPDLIAQEYCDEFLRLTDQVAPFSFTVVRRIVEEDLGSPVSTHFAWINPRPIAAASLAQVHLAYTHSGTTVAVKVQREGIDEAVERDLRRARIIGWILEVTGSIAVISSAEAVDELSRWMHEELDLEHELRNLTRMYQLTRDYPNMQVPRPCPELSRARVLTAEYLPGVPFTELLRLVRANHPERLERLGVDRKALAANLLDAVLTQIFRFEFFHGDTHPGNLLAMPGNAIGFVDFGLADELDPSFRQGMIRYLAATYAGDLEGMFQGLTEVLVPARESDPNQFRTDFYEQSRRWRREREASSRGAAPKDSPTARYLVGVLRAARQNRYRVPPAILSMYRTLLTAETLASQLGGDVDLPEVGIRLFQRLQVDSIVDAFRLENLQLGLLEVMQLVRDGPRQARRVLTDIADGRFVLSVRTVESDEDRRQANHRARLVAAAAVSISLSVLIFGARDAVLPGDIRLSGVLWAALIADWIWLLILWRRLS